MFKVVLILIFFAAPLLADGGAAKPEAKAAEPSPMGLATDHYNQGLKYRDKAWKYEQRAAADKKLQDRHENLAKAEKEYKKVIEQQLAATALNADFHESFSSLGYAYRKIGEYAPALKAYDRALELVPNYVEAIEYRAEAYLGLGRLSEAKAAYETLFLRDPQRAAQLLAACRGWGTAPSAGVDSEVVAEFVLWIEAKEAAAREMTGANEGGQEQW